jgi:hypothetical protein
MTGDDNPNIRRAQMMALLSLLDVLRGDAEMSAVAIDRVGTATGGRYAGKVRLKFSVFGDEQRMMALATELTELGTDREIRRYLESRIDRDTKMAFAVRMIASWTEVMRRLLEIGGPLALPPGQDEPVEMRGVLPPGTGVRRLREP